MQVWWPFVCEKKRFAQKLHTRKDDGRRAIALAHSWNELKNTSLISVILYFNYFAAYRRLDMSSTWDKIP